MNSLPQQGLARMETIAGEEVISVAATDTETAPASTL